MQLGVLNLDRVRHSVLNPEIKFKMATMEEGLHLEKGLLAK